MTGIDLHAIYRRKLLEQGVESDTWGELEDTDQKAWNALAEELMEG